MAKTKVNTGKEILKTVPRDQQQQAKMVARSVVLNFDKAMKTFSEVGRVGGAINSTAPMILLKKDARLPQLPLLNASDTQNMSLDLLHALLSEGFQESLTGLQWRLANERLEGQVKLLRDFSSIDWAGLARGVAPDAGTLAKFSDWLHKKDQMKIIKKADLNDVVILNQVPQFTRMLVLASGYGYLMLDAFDSYTRVKSALELDSKNNEALVAELNKIQEEFTEAELGRIEGVAKVEQLTDELEHLLETAKVLAESTNRSEEMATRIRTATDLVSTMDMTNKSTMKAQEEMMAELGINIHFLTYAQVRQAMISQAVQSLNLYIKTYCGFKYLLSMSQVFLIAASTAVRTLVFENIHRSTGKVGKEFYEENVRPLLGVVENFENTFDLKASQVIDAESVEDVPNLLDTKK